MSDQRSSGPWSDFAGALSGRDRDERDRSASYQRPQVIVTTTPSIEGRPVQAYLGVVTGEAILGANVFRDIFAGLRDIVGGRSGSYERVLREARDAALMELIDEASRRGANAVIGVDLDYETIGDTGSMLMVSASGTAVRV
jgi:uncharacterized protein YbjQ (UPF0145 family)